MINLLRITRTYFYLEENLFDTLGYITIWIFNHFFLKLLRDSFSNMSCHMLSSVSIKYTKHSSMNIIAESILCTISYII